jgi:hypothetical protein
MGFTWAKTNKIRRRLFCLLGIQRTLRQIMHTTSRYKLRYLAPSFKFVVAHNVLRRHIALHASSRRYGAIQQAHPDRRAHRLHRLRPICCYPWKTCGAIYTAPVLFHPVVAMHSGLPTVAVPLLRAAAAVATV